MDRPFDPAPLLLTVVYPLILAFLGWRAWQKERRQRAEQQGPILSSAVREGYALPKGRRVRPVDIDRTARVLFEDFEGKFALVLFRHGTCVPVHPSAAMAQDAIAVLDTLFRRPSGFNAWLLMDHWIVTYAHLAYSIAFSDDLQRNLDLVGDEYLEWLVEGEVLVNIKGSPVDHDERVRVGLFARRHAFLDARDPQVERIVMPAPLG